MDLTEYKEKINETINEAISRRLLQASAPRKQESKPESEDNDGGDMVLESLEDDDLDEDELARQLEAADNGRGRRRGTTGTPVKGRQLNHRENTGASHANNPFNKPLILSEPLSRLLGGATEMSRPQVVKQVWVYVKEHELQDPKDKRIFICDELMLAVMKKPRVNMFAMNKILSDHLIRTEDTVGGVSPSPKRAKAARKPKASRRRGGDDQPRKTNVFNRPHILSEPLSRLVGGAKEMSRPQVVKHIWAYIREHNLQDPTDKRMLNCDELMREVMGEERINCFAMNKAISAHLTKKEGTEFEKESEENSDLSDPEPSDSLDDDDDV